MDFNDKNTASNNFILDLKSIVRANFDNEQFGVGALSRKYGLSRTQLYKRIKRITGKSPSQFINVVRLKEAHSLLQNTDANITDIAFQVGFHSAAYFSSCFKAHFHYTPLEAKVKFNAIERTVTTHTEDEAVLVKEKDFEIRIKPNRYARLKYVTVFAALLVLAALIGYDIQNRSSKVVGEKSIAVLRFMNISDDPTKTFFSDGLSEELINSLAKLEEVKVIARTSSFLYDKAEDITVIANQLGVNYILVGSVRHDNQKIRVTAQLINAKDGGYHLWSETYDRELKDILFLQEDISRDVARELEIKLSEQEDNALKKKATLNMAAYNLYNEAIQIAVTNSIDEVAKAIKLLNQAIELDPYFGLAHARLAQLYEQHNFIGDLGWNETLRLMQSHVDKAFESDSEFSEAYIAKGYLEKRKSNFNEARNAFEKAIELSPNNAQAHHALAGTFTVENRKQRYEEFLKAFELDPLNPSISLMVGQYYYFVKKDYPKAKEILYNSINKHPKNDLATYHLGYYNSALPTGDLVGTFKNSFEKYKKSPEKRRELNWLFYASSWLDLKPVCEMLNNKMRLRYPTNIHTLWNMYANNALNGRFVENVDLVTFWKDNQDLKKFELVNYMAESYINGNKPGLAKKIIEDSIPEIKSENYALEGQMYHGITNNKLDVTEKYIIALKELNQNIEAHKYVNLTVTYIDQFLAQLEIDQALDYRVALYLKLVKASITDDLEMVEKVFGDAYFNDNHKVWMYDDLLIRARFKRFKNQPEFIQFRNRVKKDIYQQRDEVITYLKVEGYWESSWDKQLGLAEISIKD